MKQKIIEDLTLTKTVMFLVFHQNNKQPNILKYSEKIGTSTIVTRILYKQ